MSPSENPDDLSRIRLNVVAYVQSSSKIQTLCNLVQCSLTWVVCVLNNVKNKFSCDVESN